MIDARFLPKKSDTAIIMDFAAFCKCFSHKKQIVRGMSFVKIRAGGEKGTAPQKCGAVRDNYLFSSRSATPLSQSPLKDSMSPASTSAARAGSMGISASRGSLWAFAASAVLP